MLDGAGLIVSAMEFLLEIIRRTPPWVWGILVLLVVLGVQQGRERRVSRARLLILPLAMAAFALFSLVRGLGWNPVALAGWAAGMGVAVAANEFLLRSPRGVRAEAAGGPWIVPGSWTPMILMMWIFLARYAFAVTLAMHPERSADATFVAASAGLFGLLSGIFAARAIRIGRTTPAEVSLA